jgi:hypothetical protein
MQLLYRSIGVYQFLERWYFFFLLGMGYCIEKKTKLWVIYSEENNYSGLVSYVEKFWWICWSSLILYCLVVGALWYLMFSWCPQHFPPLVFGWYFDVLRGKLHVKKKKKFCGANLDHLCNLLCLFLCFEVISGLRINLDKSELFPIGNVNNVEGLASILVCRVSSLPCNI